MSVLHTAVPGLRLVPLAASDAEELFTLLQAESGHLNRWSDHREQIDTDIPTWQQTLGHVDPPLDFGVRLLGRLIGRAGVVSHGVRDGLGYWICESAGGRGCATAAVGALVDHAKDALGARDVLAGVTHGNLPSVRVLKRNGFTHVADFEHYARYHRRLGAHGLTSEQAASL